MNASPDARIVYEWTRFQAIDQWWHIFALVTCILLIISYVVLWYRKDWGELPRPLGVALLLLRLTAFAGIFFFFLDLQKRTEQKTIRPSRLALLIDTSLSMSLPDTREEGQSEEVPRMNQVIKSLTESDWLEQLQRQHDVFVYRFDEHPRPHLLASFPRPAKTATETSGDTMDGPTSLWRATSIAAWIGTCLAAIGFGFGLIGLTSRILGSTGSRSAGLVLAGTVGLIMGGIVIGTAVLRSAPLPIFSLWKSSPPTQVDWPNPSVAKSLSSDLAEAKEPAWSEWLNATGTETRLGDALHAILEDERGSPLAGIVLVTDGQSNSGLDPMAGIGEAILSRVAIFPIGIGTTATPASLRVVDVDAPKRVFPEDRFRITALLQSTGLEGRSVTVQLRASAANAASTSFSIDEELTVVLQPEDALQPVHFDVMPKEAGDWIYDIKVLAPPEDKNVADNTSDTLVRVVQPKSKVLTIASGPTREYQFVRNLLFRDSTIQSHVLLQSGGPGISQESQKLLEEFPKSLQELSEYDCVISFDADWMKLDVAQVQILEEWVSQYSGGLILITDNLATPRWAGTEGNGDRRAEWIRNLSPVEMTSRGARLFSADRMDTDTAWGLTLTEDGMRCPFMNVADTPAASRKVWENFSGVFSYFPAYDPKPGAMVLTTFSNPSTAMQGKQPIYMATQFFGSGRVVFQGSGEIWRLREAGVSYFDTYFMKMIRWAGEGRLLRDSDRGVLLVDKEEALVGEQIAVRAVLKDAQFRPLIVPQVDARIVDPKQRVSPLVLKPLQDPSQPGVYVGQYLGKQTGTYSVQVTIGGLNDQEVLGQQTTVRVPAREIQRPMRNDPLLAELASKTGGTYFVGLADATTSKEPAGPESPLTPIAMAIEPKDQVNYLPGAPDRDFQIRLLASLMALIGGCLSLEWLIRRLSKLA